MTHRAAILFSLVALAMSTVTAQAQGVPGACAPAACVSQGCMQPACHQIACRPQVSYVQKTVMCPQMVTESRVVNCTVCRPEVRQRTVTCYRAVAETTMVRQAYTVMVPETRTRTEQYTVCVPEWREEQRSYTVMVPVCEKRQGTRMVCQMQPVEQKRMVCVDQGHWEEQSVVPPACGPAAAPAPCAPAACAPAACMPQSCRVWVSKPVQQEITVTCMRPTMVAVPCEYTVMSCRPETRTCTVRVCSYRAEVRSRQVCYTVCVPRQQERVCPVTTCRMVPYQVVQNYTVMVPQTVQKVVNYCVCRMVPKTVCVPVCSAPCATSCCPTRVRHHGCRRGC